MSGPEEEKTQAPLTTDELRELRRVLEEKGHRKWLLSHLLRIIGFVFSGAAFAKLLWDLLRDALGG